QARTLKRPHLMRGCRRVGESSVEAVLLQEDGIKPHAGLTRIAERSGHEREAGKVVVKIERKGLFQPTAGTASANFNVLPRFAQLSLRVTHPGIGSIKRKIAHALACNGDYLPGLRAGIIQSGNRILTGKAGLQIAIGEKQELRCGRLHAQPVGSGNSIQKGVYIKGVYIRWKEKKIRSSKSKGLVHDLQYVAVSGLSAVAVV